MHLWAVSISLMPDREDDAEAQIADCVENFRKEKEFAELEIRLGTFSEGQFCPGVSKDVFFQLERDLLDAPSLAADPGWIEHTDFHYTTSRNQTARTRVAYDTNNIELCKTHTIKSSQQNVIFRRTEGGDEAFRIACSTEEPLLDPPGTCLPTHVRIKQRKCFRDVRNGSVVWSYELSKSWSASSRDAVEHKQHTMEPVYEVECELQDIGRSYVDRRSNVQVAQSLLMKGKLLLGEEVHTRLEMCSDGHRIAKRGTRNVPSGRGPRARHQTLS